MTTGSPRVQNVSRFQKLNTNNPIVTSSKGTPKRINKITGFYFQQQPGAQPVPSMVKSSMAYAKPTKSSKNHVNMVSVR